MRPICKLYLWICRRWGPGGMTLSAWLWKRELDGKGCVWREFVDDFFLCFADQIDHCEQQYQRETKPRP